MNGGYVTFGRSKDARQFVGINNMHGGTSNFHHGFTSGSSQPFTGINNLHGGTANFHGSPVSTPAGQNPPSATNPALTNALANALANNPASAQAIANAIATSGRRLEEDAGSLDVLDIDD